MLRIVLTHLVLFLLPFVGYAVWLAANRKAQTSENWRNGPIIWLIIAGAVIVAGSLVGLASFESRPEGKVYVPAQIRDGQFIPGHYEDRDEP